MDREQLIKALYDNWMNNYFKEDQDIISIEKKILDLIQTTSNDPDIQAKLLEIEGLLGQLTAKSLEDGFHDGFLTAVTLTKK